MMPRRTQTLRQEVLVCDHIPILLVQGFLLSSEVTECAQCLGVQQPVQDVPAGVYPVIEWAQKRIH